METLPQASISIGLKFVFVVCHYQHYYSTLQAKMSMITGRHKPSTPFFSFPPVPPLSHLDLKLTWEERGLYLTKPRMGLKFTKRSRYVRTLVLVEGFLRIRGMSRLWTLRWNRPGSIEGSFYFIFI